jgi:hypothetical protein
MTREIGASGITRLATIPRPIKLVTPTIISSLHPVLMPFFVGAVACGRRGGGTLMVRGKQIAALIGKLIIPSPPP